MGRVQGSHLSGSGPLTCFGTFQTRAAAWEPRVAPLPRITHSMAARGAESARRRRVGRSDPSRSSLGRVRLRDVLDTEGREAALTPVLRSFSGPFLPRLPRVGPATRLGLPCTSPCAFHAPSLPLHRAPPCTTRWAPRAPDPSACPERLHLVSSAPPPRAGAHRSAPPRCRPRHPRHPSRGAGPRVARDRTGPSDPKLPTKARGISGQSTGCGRTRNADGSPRDARRLPSPL